MKILAISDIHDNVPAVRKLRSREPNSYDIIIVAGDIGTQNTSKIFDILTTYDCPILYVYGNWDDKLSYETKWSPNGVHLDLKSFKFGRYNFVGFSGHRLNWGANPMYVSHLKNGESQIAPILVKLEDVKAERLLNEQVFGKSANPERKKLQVKISRLKQKKQELEHKYFWNVDELIEQQHRNALYELLERLGSDIERTIVVTHERLWRIHEKLKGVPLYLFGHTHKFQDTAYQGSRFVNVAALGEVSWITQTEGAEDSFGFNAGSYVSLEVSPKGHVSIDSRNLGPIPDRFIDTSMKMHGEYAIHSDETSFHW
jgi:predicted phosphodiesterase